MTGGAAPGPQVPGSAAAEPAGDGPNRWHDARPELVIAGVLVAATALAGGAVAGWPGVAAVAAGAAALSMVVLRGLVPRSAAQHVRRARDRQTARAIAGYGQRRYVVAAGVSTRAFYESELRPVLEHLLAARLAENHGVNLYTEPDAARGVFCRNRGDVALWRWVDPALALPPEGRERERGGIPRRTLARLVNRLEQL